MKTMNVRELRQTIPRLEQTLASDGELLLVSNGKPIARLSPVTSRPKLPSLKAFRSGLPTMKTSSAALIREDRDRRGG